MNKSQRLKQLLEKGYFPAELPPPFVTKSLAKYRTSILDDWSSLNQPKAFHYEVYSYPKIGHQRRKLAVVNPISQLLLSKEIADSWIEIQKFISKSEISLDSPILEPDAARAIPKPDFNLVGLKRLDVGSEYTHILVSDISRFYGTIYTHSLPWALHGKDWCKANLHTPAMKASLGNRLEKLATKGQDNQTIGLPIGPDTSRILSEIVAVAVENEFLSATGVNASRVFRYVDDWFIGFDAAGEAEDAVAFLSKACSRYELELHNGKTKVVDPLNPTDELWPIDMRDHFIREDVRNQAKDIQHFFSKAFHYAAQKEDASVMLYALNKVRFIKLKEENALLFESHILRAARANPRTLPVVAQIFINQKNQGLQVSEKKVEKLIGDAILKSALVGHHGELSWALFLAKGLKVKISRKIIDNVLKVESSICALITLDLRRLGLIDADIDTSFWESFMSEDGLRSHMWLLAYEADIKGWLASPAAHVDNHPHFRVLKNRGVYFYDLNKNVPTYEKSKKKIEKELERKLKNTKFLTWVQNYRSRSM